MPPKLFRERCAWHGPDHALDNERDPNSNQCRRRTSARRATGLRRSSGQVSGQNALHPGVLKQSEKAVKTRHRTAFRTVQNSGTGHRPGWDAGREFARVTRRARLPAQQARSQRGAGGDHRQRRQRVPDHDEERRIVEAVEGVDRAPRAPRRAAPAAAPASAGDAGAARRSVTSSAASGRDRQQRDGR